jgi:hypothetical protein
MDLLRILISFVGVLVGLFGLAVVWGSWLDGHSTTTGWVITGVGAALWLSVQGVLGAERRKNYERKVQEELRKLNKD